MKKPKPNSIGYKVTYELLGELFQKAGYAPEGYELIEGDKQEYIHLDYYIKEK